MWAIRRGWSGPRRQGIDDEDAVWVVFSSHEEVSSHSQSRECRYLVRDMSTKQFPKIFLDSGLFVLET